MSNLKRQTSYSGPERRRHKVYLTRNSEYHCRDEVCVAVRDLRTGEFMPEHPAIGRRMTGGVRFSEGSVQSFSRPGEDPHPGETLFFSDGSLEMSLQTSALRKVERPPKDIVAQYRH